ncbi:MAG TPA: ribosome small subunit-dependent GTPase A [Bacillales bacterium]|nr:ribosome small subunit-dependent GTPase A [Bacillales bacterium]
MDLKRLGWTLDLEDAFSSYKKEGFTIGRVALEHKGMYRIFTENGDLLAEITGHFRFNAFEREDYPAVGDWVVIKELDEEKAMIHAVMPRKSKFSRQVAGRETAEQIVAANVDTVFLVNALNRDFNPRRLERYLSIAWESGASPVIILSKADLCEDVTDKVAQTEAVAFGVPIHVVSAATNDGFEVLKGYFAKNETVALLGSSGVGKSTLINRLYGQEVQTVKEIREGDDRGRHTTTHREMVLLPEGGIVIDTPGMRELQLWDTDEGLGYSFSDVEELAAECKFRDCKHEGEPGCAVQVAIESGELEQSRFENYLKLQKEMAFLERKTNKRLQKEEREKWKKIAGDRTRVSRKR